MKSILQHLAALAVVTKKVAKAQTGDTLSSSCFTKSESIAGFGNRGQAFDHMEVLRSDAFKLEMRLVQIMGCVDIDDRLTSVILTLMDRDTGEVLHLPQIGSGNMPDVTCEYFVLDKADSFFEKVQIGWDYKGISSMMVEGSNTQQKAFGGMQAALWQQIFTQGKQLIGMSGTELDERTAISSIGFITFNEAECSVEVTEEEVGEQENAESEQETPIEKAEEQGGQEEQSTQVTGGEQVEEANEVETNTDQNEAQPQPEQEPQPDPQPDPEPQPEQEPQLDPQSQPDQEPQPETDTQPQSETQGQPDTEQNTEPEPQPSPQEESVSQGEANPEDVEISQKNEEAFKSDETQEESQNQQETQTEPQPSSESQNESQQQTTETIEPTTGQTTEQDPRSQDEEEQSTSQAEVDGSELTEDDGQQLDNQLDEEQGLEQTNSAQDINPEPEIASYLDSEASNLAGDSQKDETSNESVKPSSDTKAPSNTSATSQDEAEQTFTSETIDSEDNSTTIVAVIIALSMAAFVCLVIGLFCLVKRAKRGKNKAKVVDSNARDITSGRNNDGRFDTERPLNSPASPNVAINVQAMQTPALMMGKGLQDSTQSEMENNMDINNPVFIAPQRQRRDQSVESLDYLKNHSVRGGGLSSSHQNRSGAEISAEQVQDGTNDSMTPRDRLRGNQREHKQSKEVIQLKNKLVRNDRMSSNRRQEENFVRLPEILDNKVLNMFQDQLEHGLEIDQNQNLNEIITSEDEQIKSSRKLVEDGKRQFETMSNIAGHNQMQRSSFEMYQEQLAVGSSSQAATQAQASQVIER